MHAVAGLDPEQAEKQPFIASMGIYVFKKDVLVDLLKKKYPGSNDFGGEIIPMAAAEGQKVIAYLFNDYWEDIGTIKSFFDANLALAQTVRQLLPHCMGRSSRAPQLQIRAAVTASVLMHTSEHGVYATLRLANTRISECHLRPLASCLLVPEDRLTDEDYRYCLNTHAHQQALCACDFETVITLIAVNAI